MMMPMTNTNKDHDIIIMNVYISSTIRKHFFHFHSFSAFESASSLNKKEVISSILSADRRRGDYSEIASTL